MREGLRRTLMVLVGTVLLAAAGLKLYGLSVSPLPSVGWLSVPSVQLAVVAAELFVGGWLISGVARPLAWLAGLLMFSTFAVVSGYLGFIGQATCGCFGTIQASPWVALMVDVIALTLMALIRPTQDEWQHPGTLQSALRVLGMLGGAVTLLTVAVIGCIILYGSTSAALSKLRGVVLGAPDYVDFGIAKPGERLERIVEIHNWTDQSVRLIGGTSDCSCVTTSQMPVTINPGQMIGLTILFKVPEAERGQHTRWVSILTDHKDQTKIRIRLGCRTE